MNSEFSKSIQQLASQVREESKIICEVREGK